MQVKNGETNMMMNSYIVNAFLKISNSFALFNLQLRVTRSSEKYNKYVLVGVFDKYKNIFIIFFRRGI